MSNDFWLGLAVGVAIAEFISAMLLRKTMIDMWKLFKEMRNDK